MFPTTSLSFVKLEDLKPGTIFQSRGTWKLAVQAEQNNRVELAAIRLTGKERVGTIDWDEKIAGETSVLAVERWTPVLHEFHPPTVSGPPYAAMAVTAKGNAVWARDIRQGYSINERCFSIDGTEITRSIGVSARSCLRMEHWSIAVGQPHFEPAVIAQVKAVDYSTT